MLESVAGAIEKVSEQSVEENVSFFDKLESDTEVPKPEITKNTELVNTFWDSLEESSNERTAENILGASEQNITIKKLDDLSESQSGFPKPEVVDGKTYYYDSLGNIYRVDNELIPNNTYEVNGYKYTTDEQGRIISAEGQLHLKDRDGRLPIKDSLADIGKGDEKENDDRGHLIGDQFNGSNGLENMVPQDANINRNDFRNFENELAKEVKDGKDVDVKVEPVYDGNSRRPEAIVVTYTINGETNTRIFPNGKE